MSIANSVVLMNSNTYELFLKTAKETASKKPDPIAYIATFHAIDIRVDDTLKDGMTEIWDEKTYEEYLNRNGGSSDEKGN
jgi:hypothetical protein